MIRASDAERERAAEQLRKHHADGRLSTEELEERTERVYASKTVDELDEPFADLPRPAVPARERQQRRPMFWPPLFPVIPIVFAVVVISSGHFPFVMVPLMFFVFLRFRLMRRRWI